MKISFAGLLFLIPFTVNTFATIPVEHQWSYGQGAVYLGNGLTQYCWLTGIRGQFNSNTSEVGVNHDGQLWTMSGHSGQVGTLGGWAMCVNSLLSSSQRQRFTWLSYQGGSTRMSNTNQSFCHLAKVRGSMGKGDFVRIGKYNNEWLLEGSDPVAGLAAEAECVSNWLPVNVWKTFGWSWPSKEITLTKVNTTVCGLLSVNGPMNQVWDWVRIQVKNDRYVLSGSLLTPGMSAVALCVPRPV